ncbi:MULTISPECIES: mycofactocin biosynthesis glycosyltransferase MftF [unclassified Nocardioides]|uniref:mycofactocin biosynthesis glycosyltransferase MftF n=1 Tax=unclassified Nocardioides TaxID=2615069 RepID=UPI0006F30F5A|nr:MULTISPECIES: mycofactocin biosynthesis glycosyltransferase MftF [unclassified Nocardioides]KQY50087.1 hypothetical protein ASD30_21375 [Nocardioides sp. Root140]KQZ75711.1 hypothetical protein ASD66_05100 [Nocardioides sp. Root151]KRF14783.1 hypothetical protein ASH02_10885 [Nocardioides sp. Soil796]
MNPHVRQYDGGRVLVGGSPGRLMRLSAKAVTLLDGDELAVSSVTAVLAERLLDAGMMDPVAATLPTPSLDELSVVVPVRDRPRQLDRLLGALPRDVHVLVVDDASKRPDLVAATAKKHGAEVVALSVNVGPAAARNRGFAASRTPYVAFVDSDVVPDPGTFDVLLRHFADPGLALVAPRILGLQSETARSRGTVDVLDRYEAAMSSLDRGPDPALVRPMSRVAWLPSACVVVRRTALAACDGFSEEMRVGEDVDLVWRLASSGHRVRYEPGVSVQHEHRVSPRSWLVRKAVYGTSAAPLAERHGPAVAPAVFTPWTVAFAAAVVAQRRWSLPVAGAVWALAAGRLVQRCRPTTGQGIAWPATTQLAARLSYDGASSSLQQVGALALRHWWPVVLPAALVSSRVRRVVAVAAVADAAHEWRRTRPDLDPVNFLVARRLDDLAYGAGVWSGAFRARSARALLPRLTR